MKKIFFISLVFSVSFFACKKDPDYTKPGVSLPAVTGLTLQKVDVNNVRLTWQNPSNIPAEMKLPLSINIQVNDIQSPTKSVSAATINLDNAPNTYSYKLPDSSKTYHFIVKLFGTTKSTDKNYSNTIYSLGQTVIYQK